MLLLLLLSVVASEAAAAHQQESQTIPVMPIPPQIVISALHPPSLQLARARVRDTVCE